MMQRIQKGKEMFSKEVEFFETFHEKAADLYDQYINEQDSVKKGILRKKWCEFDSAFFTLSGMTLYQANKYFLTE